MSLRVFYSRSGLSLVAIAIWFVVLAPAGAAEKPKIGDRVDPYELYGSPPTVEGPGRDVIVPLLRGKNARLYVAVEIGGTKLTFLLDTGAPFILVSPAILEAAKVPSIPLPSGIVFGAGGAVDAAVARLPSLRVGDVTLKDCSVVISNLSEWSAREKAAQGVHIHGILGTEFLDMLNAQIDFGRSTLTLRYPTPQK